MNYESHAREVILSYPISNPKIEFIRHNENMTYKVTDQNNNKAYLLRIHTPITKGMSKLQHTYEGVKSEIEMLQYLNDCGTLKVQKPAANCRGEYVTYYQNEELPMPCYATLLEWIEGPTLTLEEDNVEELVFKLGERLAVFHEASRKFKHSKEFVRPIYDIKGLEEGVEEISCGIDNGVFSSSQYELMKKTAEVVKEKIKELDSREAGFGIIHSDLQKGNTVIHEGEPVFIDFGFSGFGYYLFDLGSGAGMLKSSLRKPFLEGYASKGEFFSEDIRYIECLMFADIFVSYALFIRDDKVNGWIKGHAEKLCGDICSKFLQGEEVFYLF